MRRALAILTSSALIFACNFPTLQPQATATPEVNPTSAPAEVTPPLTPTATFAAPCDMDALLTDLRRDFPYTYQSAPVDHAVVHYRLRNTHSLIVWFRDPALDPVSDPEDVADNAAKAQEHASYAAAAILKAHPCVANTFSALDLLVVDTNQNAWFSASVSPAVILDGERQPDAEETSLAWEGAYLRSAPPPEASTAGSCTWDEVRRRAKGHFAGSEDPAVNMDFYAVADARGMIVYGQWLAFSDTFIPTAEMASVLNVARELDCLYRPVDQLALTVVDGRGNVKMLGTLTGQEAIRNLDLEQFDFRVVTEVNP